MFFSYPDKVRGRRSILALSLCHDVLSSLAISAGVFNEGGLFGERKGWHLPGFDVSGWEPRELVQGLPGSIAGVGFFVTTFELKIPKGLDVPMAFEFKELFGQPYRVLLFVNGWMMGKRVGNLG